MAKRKKRSLKRKVIELIGLRLIAKRAAGRQKKIRRRAVPVLLLGYLLKKNISNRGNESGAKGTQTMAARIGTNILRKKPAKSAGRAVAGKLLRFAYGRLTKKKNRKQRGLLLRKR